MDEPAAYLDEEGRALLSEALKDLGGLVVGYVEHGDGGVKCDRRYQVEAGVVKQTSG